MNLQDRLPPVDVRFVHQDLPVEPPRAQQGRVQDLRAVGGAHDDDSLVGFEPVHFHQELVERLLALVVSAHDIHSPGFAQGIQFIDKDDAGSAGRRLGEKIADAGRPHPDEHFHKLRSADAEEGHVRLSGNGLGQQGFACPRRAEQEDPFGDLPPQFLKFTRVLQKLHDFLKFFFGFVDPGHIGKSDAGLHPGQKAWPCFC